jgi:RNA polymerase sigma-70 factor (ECF subfamily)
MSIDQHLEETESELIRRVKAGDHKAFEDLFARYVSRVYGQAIKLMRNPEEAQEVVQEVFLTVYTKIGTFRGKAAFSTWLYRLTANAAITRLRKRKRRNETPLDDYLPKFGEGGHHLARPLADWSHELERRLSEVELQGAIQEALDELPPLDKAVVVLSDMEDLPNREIAKILELTVPAVKARLHRARLFLRGKLALHLGHSPT